DALKLGTHVPVCKPVWNFRQKKAQPLPAGPWKFWERMPERPALYVANRTFVQVRIVHLRLHKLQLLFIIAEYCYISAIWLYMQKARMPHK
ncbi:MAG: hypothetical protein WCY11_15680, partial [Novosphingobium sp.]